MRRVHSLLQDGFEEAEAVTASRRSVIVGSLKLASGTAVALALAGTPGMAQIALADSHPAEGQGGGGGQGGQGGGGGGQGGQGGGGGQGGQGGGGGRGAQGGTQVNGVPSTGIGIAGGSDGQTAGLIGLAAVGAAAAAVFVRHRATMEQATDA